MSQGEISESLALLEQDWEIDPVLKDFVLHRVYNVSDYVLRIGDVAFHIPYLTDHKKYVLWKCYWPDCHNCCNRQGRLPLTSEDLITIGRGLKYSKVSDFVQNETVTATWEEESPGGRCAIMTMVGLKRKDDETAADDGTHVPCRFLDEKGACRLHPERPGVCRLYPFSTWLVNEGGHARVHATFQFTGDCPGFYLADSVDGMMEILKEYSIVIYNYNLQSARTTREGFGATSF